ncbi:MAG TPA: Clp protease N-terminal domain-containing protein [Planosporangium sp.]|jgi:hypothetical protein|nr:Clp protease N-terminal domain-containing protein [Planosporangium sp.]
MTLFDSFTPSATATVVRAGRLAAEAGGQRLRTDFLLLALAEGGHLTPPLDALAERGGAVRDHIPEYVSGRGDRELLASLGIDLDEVRRIAEVNTGVRLDDARLWRLERSRLRPLRLILSGPACGLRLDGRSRKVVEVARYWARRRGTPVAPEHLLWGLLADHSNESVRVLHHLGVDCGVLWRGLQRWYARPGTVR